MSNNPAFAVYPTKTYSYKTCIVQLLPAGIDPDGLAHWITLGNVTRYTKTTSMHQNKCEVKNCDVLLDNVPRDTDDLSTLALQRGAIEYANGAYHVVDVIDTMIDVAWIMPAALLAAYP